MTRAPRAPRAALPAVVAVVAVGLTAACSVNAGSAKARQFEEDWRGTPDVAEVWAGGSNTLPFLGSADGTLVVEPGTSPERVAELFHALGEYVHAHEDVGGSLEVEHMTLGAWADRERNDAALDLWRRLRDDPAVVGAELGPGEVSVDLDDPARFSDVVEDLTTPGGDLEPLAGSRVLVTTGPLDAEVGRGDDPTAVLDAFRAVDERYDVTEARLTTFPEPSVELRVAGSADIAGAQALARSAAPEIADALVVEGGGVSFDGTDAHESAEALDLARTLETRPDVTGVTVVDDGLELHVLDVDAAVVLAHDLSDEPAAAALRSVTAANDDVGPGVPSPQVFRVVVAGREPGALTAAQVRDLGAAVPSLVRVAARDGVDAELSDPTVAEVETLARELAARVPAGTPVQVRAGGDFAVELTAGPDPEPEEITYPTRIGGEVFTAAWRDAWP